MGIIKETSRLALGKLGLVYRRATPRYAKEKNVYVRARARMVCTWEYEAKEVGIDAAER